ncbi:MAG: aromatic amino acid hydroxylase [Bacillaceae bacterium]
MIPIQLKPYIATQHYDQYSPIDHAVWRYIMHQNIHFLQDVAHPAYVEGMKAYGINIEYIPNVTEMNTCLQKAGFGAATIDGLIPGVAFFDFQGNGILPIATAIRRVENIEYTPAPDIVHEAAGHAPILFDEKYATYIKLIGSIGAKAFATKEEHALFDAVRELTIVAENTASTKEEIAEAEALVQTRQAAINGLSEAEQISRLFWWTVEYGLIGDTINPKIYGAGLLSSVGESRHCLTSHVKKIPYSIDACIQTAFDVTKMQPQLFVCKSFDELIESIEQFAHSMAFYTGGTSGLEKALQSQNFATFQFSSGLQVSGIVSELLKNEEGEAIFIRTKGPTSLAINNKQLSNHGKDVHHHGFSAPLGPLKGHFDLENATDSKLEQAGIRINNKITLLFASGIKLTGTVAAILRNEEQVALLSFDSCTITYKDTLLFDPTWGRFDYPVGKTIISVYPGVADYASFFEQSNPPLLQSPPPRVQTELDSLYLDIRTIRETNQVHENIEKIHSICKKLNVYTEEWLLRLEIIELLHMHQLEPDLKEALLHTLTTLSTNPSYKNVITNGLNLVLNERTDA